MRVEPRKAGVSFKGGSHDITGPVPKIVVVRAKEYSGAATHHILPTCVMI